MLLAVEATSHFWSAKKGFAKLMHGDGTSGGLVSTAEGLQQPLKLLHILREPVLVSKLQFQREPGIRKDLWEILLKFNVTVPYLHPWESLHFEAEAFKVFGARKMQPWRM